MRLSQSVRSLSRALSWQHPRSRWIRSSIAMATALRSMAFRLRWKNRRSSDCSARMEAARRLSSASSPLSLVHRAATRASAAGVSRANAREVRRHIGVVFQEKSVDVKLTAAENLLHQGHLYGLRGAALKARIAQMLDRVGLNDRANDKVETFSGGMLRRVEIAKGLMHSPAVLLLDEPTTGLDPGARIDLWQYLRILARRRRHHGAGDHPPDGRG